MDVLVVEINDQLDVISRTETAEPGVQKGIKSLLYKKGILTLSQDESLQHSIYRCGLSYTESSGKVLWRQSYGERGYSYNPTDVVVHKDKFYVTADKREDRASLPVAVVLEIDGDGEFLREVELF